MGYFNGIFNEILIYKFGGMDINNVNNIYMYVYDMYVYIYICIHIYQSDDKYADNISGNIDGI